MPTSRAGTPQAAFYAHTTLVQAITFVLRPAAIYAALQLDVPSHLLGVMGASFAVVPLVLAVPTGAAVDRFGERRVMVVGALLTLASAVGFVAAGSTVWGLLSASALLGTGHLLSVVGQQALVANGTRRARLDSAFGHYTFAASAGQALGPILLVVFGGRATIPDTGTIFWWTAAMAVALTVAALLLPVSSTQRTGPTRHPGSVRDLLHRPGLVRALVVSSVVLAAVDISLIYLPALGAERDIPAGTIGLLLTVRAVCSMGSRFFLGRLTNRWGRGPVLTTSVAMAAAGLALLPAPMPLPLLVVVVAVAGVGLGAGQPLTMSWLAESTPEGLRGRAMSLRLTGNRLGQVVVPSAAGALAAGTGAAGVLWITAAVLALAGLNARGLATTYVPPASDPVRPAPIRKARS